jgi:predicted DCC family thiol-disulfide oxidoreductase YuxK
MPASAIILFDGVCNLCNATVAFIIQRDRHGLFRFAALQSDAARRLLAEHHFTPHALQASRPAPADAAADWQSVVLIQDGRVFQRSTAALHIARGLGFPWSLATVFLLIPTPLRDWLYSFIARHRYRWFGKRDTCAIPTPDQRARFLE